MPWDISVLNIPFEFYAAFIFLAHILTFTFHTVIRHNGYTIVYGIPIKPGES